MAAIQDKMKYYIGTSTWSQPDWVGNFYPDRAKSKDFLAEYVKRLPTVEVDSTFYAVPKTSVVENWYRIAPENFVFSAKFPQRITHELRLIDAAEETEHFLKTLSLLGEKLGVLVMQFPFDFEATLQTVEAMKSYLAKLPATGFRFAVEVRHKSWLREGFYERLHKHNIALVLADLPYMPKLDVETADFSYIRWLGNRKAMDGPFKEIRVDKHDELDAWLEIIRRLKGETLYGYFNNHFAGHSPTNAEQFAATLREAVPPDASK